MKYTVYKIINLLNEKVYVGVHKTDSLDDGYMGSGKNIKRAINKYGVENFKKEYLAVFDNPEEMFEMETQIVNEEFISSKETYNITLGGNGSWEHIKTLVSKEDRARWGGWKDRDKRRKVWESVPLKVRQDNARKMGKEFGGRNKLSDDQVNERMRKIKDIDLTRYGWVSKVAGKLEVSHTQARRFIERYYEGEVYKRK